MVDTQPYISPILLMRKLKVGHFLNSSYIYIYISPPTRNRRTEDEDDLHGSGSSDMLSVSRL